MFKFKSLGAPKPQGYLAILGGNDLACPAISHLRAIGYKVIVVDGNSACPAREIADIFIHSNFPDISGTREKLRNFNLIGVMALNDFAVSTAAQLSSERNLPGWSTTSVKSLTNKIELKRQWMKDGIPTANFTAGRVEEIVDGNFPHWDIWPCIVKPSFSGGGSRGVFLAHNRTDLQLGLIERQTSFLDGGYLLEELVKGVEHTIEVVVVNNRAKILSISDKENYMNNISVVQKLTFPGPVGRKYRRRLEVLIQMACESIELSNGAAHFEVISHASDITFLEVGGRPGGGINFHPICLISTGFDYPRILAEVLTGQKVNFRRSLRLRRKLVWNYLDSGFGRLRAVHGLDLVRKKRGVVMFRIYEKIGQMRLSVIDDLHRPGFILIQGFFMRSTRWRARRIVSKIRFESE